ncbi:hypothetical protein [Salipaludibacillus aurantiacus]|uniref:Uncharacterized protein n=1 Tax=Salipaludibacillus aurantiacus TaxID=1601833 RepID=A0A1H9V016_9BACI|nr:hypothetical protein [Salipaludibacillus aurantiacus]SES14958.1 hypothetical protein SAMN05518684_10937 [Salipaludibacillus aurantiacus]
MDLNVFAFVSIILAFSAFIKVFFGVFYHEQLYDWAKKHYSQEKWSTPVKGLLIYAVALFLLVWYATLTGYIAYGWILTVFITLASLKTVTLLFNWEHTSPKFVAFIDKSGKKLWFVDLFVAVIGFLFLWLGLMVY